MALVARTVLAAENGYGQCSWADPLGSFGFAALTSSSSAPTVTPVGSKDVTATAGDLVSVSFTSDYPGRWRTFASPDGSSEVHSGSGTSFSINWQIPLNHVGRSYYIAALCRNNGGWGWNFVRLHVDVNGIVWIGPNQTHTSVSAGFSAGAAGYTFILEDGQYSTAVNNNMHIDADGGSNLRQPPPGTYTTDNSGTNPVYTITKFTTVMAESPFGYELDATSSYYALNLYGDTAYEQEFVDEGFTGNTSTGTNTTRRGLVISGLITKYAQATGFHTNFADHIIFEYCYDYDSGRYAFDPGGGRASTNFNITRSTDCIVQNCGAHGEGRYKFSGYITARCTYQSCISRTDQRDGWQIYGSFISYSGRDTVFRNCIAIDGDQLDVFLYGVDAGDAQNPTQDGGVFSNPATGHESFPRNLRWDGCGSYNNQITMGIQNARNAPLTDTSGGDDLCVWRSYPLEDGFVGGWSGGPFDLNRVTINHHTSPESFLVNSLYSRVDLTKFILNDVSVSENIFASADLNPLTVDDGYLYNYSATSLSNGNASRTVDISNLNELDDPFSLGLRYFGRTEPSSPLEIGGYGCSDRFWTTVGTRTRFQDAADFFNETDDIWLLKTMCELWKPLQRDHTFTGNSRPDGQDRTLSGNRGWATDDWNDLVNYLLSDAAGGSPRDVPFPMKFSASKDGTDLIVSWEPFEGILRDNLNRLEIYIDGAKAMEVGVEDHQATFPGLVVGHTYTVFMIAIDDIHGTSGISFVKEVTL